MDFLKETLQGLENETLNDILSGDAKRVVETAKIETWSPDLISLGILILIVTVILYFMNSSCWWIVLVVGIGILFLLNYACNIKLEDLVGNKIT